MDPTQAHEGHQQDPEDRAEYLREMRMRGRLLALLVDGRLIDPDEEHRTERARTMLLYMVRFPWLAEDVR